MEITKAAVWAEASKAGQPIDDLRQQRKDAWLRCLDHAAILAELRAQGEVLRARAAEHLGDVVARVPVGAAEDGSVLGDEESPGAGAGRAMTVEEVQSRISESKIALEQWLEAARLTKSGLARATDEVVRGLKPEVRNAVVFACVCAVVCAAVCAHAA